ncbi:MAG: hypothetical protein ACT4PT_09510 [Methanobacteriota archaeon]
MPLADERGVAVVVGAILIASTLTALLILVRISWVPVWVEEKEAGHSDVLRQALSDWGATAESHVARDLAGRSFAADFPVGSDGVPIFGGGKTAGRVSVIPGPSLTVFRDATPVGSASGALEVVLPYTEYSGQTYRYSLGVLEVSQSGGAWADLRSLLTVERAPNGTRTVAIQTISVTGSQVSATSPDSVNVAATLRDASSTAQTAGNARIVATNVSAGAWRAGLNRTLGATGLSGEVAADCAVSAKDWCFTAGTNDGDTMDVTIRNAANGWTVSQGTIRVTVGT